MSWGSFSWGTSAWGGLASAVATTPPPGPVPTTTGIGLLIGGVDHTGYLRVPPGDLTIEDPIDSRRTCEFELLDQDGSLQRSIVTVGAAVRVMLDASMTIFAGTIDGIVESELGIDSGYVVYQIECVDFTQLCDRHLVAGRYVESESARYTLRDIVQDIVATTSGDTGETLADEGITAPNTTVQEGPILGTVSFDYQTATEVFNDLAGLTGFSWYVDYDKRLRFFDPRTYTAPHPLVPATWDRYRHLQVRRGRDQYRNLQYLRAGTTLTSERTEEFAGDGKTHSFSVAMPVGEKPTISVDLGAGYVAVDEDEVDVRKDEESQDSIKWFYKIGDESISQNTDEVVLATDDYVKIVYKGQYPILMQGRDDSEITQRQSIEGGTGVYAHVEDDSSIDDESMARERTSGLLRKFGRLEDVVSFQTDATGFASGQSLTVDIGTLGAVGTYLIEQVRFRYRGTTEADAIVWEFDVRAVKGETRGGFATYYQRLAAKGRPLSIRENEQLHLLRTRRSGVILGATVSVTAALREWDDDASDYALIGLAVIGGRRKGDAFAISSTEDGAVYGPLIGLPYLP